MTPEELKQQVYRRAPLEVYEAVMAALPETDESTVTVIANWLTNFLPSAPPPLTPAEVEAIWHALSE